jgi:hypothetical protein
VIADGAIDRATFAADTGLQSIRSGTAQSGTSTEIVLDAGASGTNDFYKDTWIYLTGGTGVGQVRRCTIYAGGTKIASILDAWITAPDNTTTFAIYGRSVGRVQSLAADTITAVSIASGAITSAKFAAGAINADAIASDAITDAKVAADVTIASVTGAVGSVVGSVASVTNPVTVSGLTASDVGAIKTNTDQLAFATVDTISCVQANIEGINADGETANDLQRSAKTIVYGTVAASPAPTTTAFAAGDLDSTVNDHYNGRIVIFTDGVLKDQASNITDYDGGNKLLTVTALTSAPVAGVHFVIV